MNAKKYSSPYDFRKALDTRLKERASSSDLPLDHLRKQVTFDRFLARLDFNRYRLKGGYSLELRLPQTVRTLDIDLAVRDKKFLLTDRQAQQKEIFDDLSSLATIDKSDFFEFKIERMLAPLPDTQEGGYRYLVSAKIDGRIYQEFHVDVAVESTELLPPDHIHSTNILSFAGIEAVDISATTKEEVFAEKLHAYVRTRQSENSRVKDLIDMAALIETGLDQDKITKAISATFENSNTYKIVPAELPTPPKSWDNTFAKIAEERGLKISLKEAHDRVSRFYNNIKQ